MYRLSLSTLLSEGVKAHGPNAMVLDDRLLNSRVVQNHAEEVVSGNIHWCGSACSAAVVQVRHLSHINAGTNKTIQFKLRRAVVAKIRPCREHSLSQ